MGEIMEDVALDMDREQLMKVAIPLFYGYAAMAALSLVGMPRYAGNIMGLAMIPAITIVSAGFSKGVEGDWKSLLDLISVISLLAALLLGTYVSATLAYM